MPYSWIQILWFFLIYAFLGWCSEVVFAAVHRGVFVNRGFLNGPVCPIYGFGVTGIAVALYPVASNTALLFPGSVLLTSFIEWLTGFVLEKIFHQKWWDYSERPFNVKGYICLEFSLLWGLAGVFVIRVVHAPIATLTQKLPFRLSVILLCVLYAIFLADFLLTLIELLKLPKKIRAMQETEKQLNALSEKIGGKLSDTAIRLKEKSGEVREKWDQSETKEELEKKKQRLEEKYRALSEKKSFTHRRILKAFPNLTDRLRKK